MKLVFKSGALAGRKFKTDANVTIGRHPSNAISIQDASVSLVHCQISVDNGRVCVKDLGSTNGTLLNGKRIINADLCDGDTLVIGKNSISIGISEQTSATREVSSSAVTVPALSAEAQDDLSVRPTVASASETRDLSGNIFGNVTYFLKRKIASGGMGAVYEAEQFGAEGFIKKVAIKTILPAYVQKESFVSSFVGEAKLVANLVHQNIVQIHQLGRHEDGYYIAMEYIDGINLTSFLQRHRRQKRIVPVEIATFIVSRICRGLEYAHGKRDDAGNPLGLVHRDVSPNNIMITKEGEVKLTDFGVAKAAQFMGNDDGYLVGSVEYMSPEQAACSEVDRRSDLYSLGLVYYELLTGVRVYQCENDDLDGTVAKVQKSEIPDPLQYRKNLAQGVVTILMKCLQKNPDDRFVTAGELGNALEREIYSKGYGPTIVTLAGYVNELYHDQSKNKA